MASTNGKSEGKSNGKPRRKKREEDRYGVLGLDWPLPDDEAETAESNRARSGERGGETAPNSPDRPDRYPGGGELGPEVATTGEGAAEEHGGGAMPPVLSERDTRDEARRLLISQNEWDALDALHEQLDHVEQTLKRVQRTLQALTEAKTAALPGRTVELLKELRRSSGGRVREEVGPLLKSQAPPFQEDYTTRQPVGMKTSPEGIDVSDDAVREAAGDDVREAFRDPDEVKINVHRPRHEPRPPRPKQATTIHPYYRPGETPPPEPNLAPGAEQPWPGSPGRPGRPEQAVRCSGNPPAEAERKPDQPLPGRPERAVCCSGNPPADVERESDQTAATTNGASPQRTPVVPADQNDGDNRRTSRVLTDKVRWTVIHYLEAGLSIRQAAAFVGCHHTTIVKAMQRDAEFAERIERAQEIGQAMPLVRILRASRRSWQAAAWLLKHQRRHAAS
ncbi:MAG: hypothetical protein RIC55_01260 [Pirellulaceae bacterium]